MQPKLADPETFKRWTIGAVTVTRVLDADPVVVEPTMFLELTREDVARYGDWLCPDYANSDGEIVLHFQAFVIEAHGKRIMVDPCIGNDKQRSHPLLAMRDSPFLDRLARAGFPRESIDVVLCTHLHVDHCGWNTMLVDGAWTPTFPNARYLFARAEIAHAKTDTFGDAQTIFADSVKPIFDHGLAELVDPGHVIVEGVRLEPTPGHTPGHCSISIASEGREAVITGDVLHHPVQTALPSVNSNYCWDKAIAARTRREILERVSARGAVLLGAHFAGPTGVFLKPDGDAWRVQEA